MSDKEKPQSAFPGRLPTEMPTDRPLSAASKRLYDMWAAQQDIEKSPLYHFQIFSYHGYRQGRIGILGVSARSVQGAENWQYLLCLVYAQAYQSASAGQKQY